MSVYDKLLKIQSTLSVPKENMNDTGNYSYRSCEDILKKLKPLLEEQKCTIILNDYLEHVGDRFYIKAIATLIDVEDGSKIEVSAYAREANALNNMDEAQVTGASSSYARKYALSGLLAIDSNKDPDDVNVRPQNKDQQGKEPTGNSNKPPKPVENGKPIAVSNLNEAYVVKISRGIYREKSMKELMDSSKYQAITWAAKNDPVAHIAAKKIIEEHRNTITEFADFWKRLDS